MGRFCLHVLLLIFSNSIVSGVYSAGTFTFVNKCAFTVWPGILSNAGIAPLEPTGFSLQTGETKIISAPESWGGRFWGRTQCGYDSTGKFSCVTGDCGSGKVECAGSGAAPPATLAEFTLNGYGGKDFYDVSLVDGYNVPMLLVPQGGSGTNCTSTGCIRDLNSACPSALQVMSSGGERVACKSACEALGNDEYCCVGAYGSPQSCQPTQYSQLFKSACPQAYSYAYDDSTSTFTCTGADYIVMFCPSPNTSRKSSSGGQNGSVDSAMMYQGALDVSVGAPPLTYGGAVVIAAAYGSYVINCNLSALKWALHNLVGLWRKRINGPRHQIGPPDEVLDQPESSRQDHSTKGKELMMHSRERKKQNKGLGIDI